MSGFPCDKQMNLTDKQYNQIYQILQENRSWVDVKSNDDTVGWCAISAVRVNYCLRKAGFKPRLVVVETDCEAHCFNELAGYILDVTADQFYECEKYVVISKIESLPVKERFWFWGFDDREDYELDNLFEVTKGFKRCLKKLEEWAPMSPQNFFIGRNRKVIAA